MKRTLIGTIILSALVCAFTSCSSCSGRRTAEDQLADSTKAALEMEKRMNAEPEFDIVTTHGTMRVNFSS